MLASGSCRLWMHSHRSRRRTAAVIVIKSLKIITSAEELGFYTRLLALCLFVFLFVASRKKTSKWIFAKILSKTYL